ncbi:MAG: hypothetical protein ACYC0F_01430 [Rhodanobacter sp.]
MSLKKYKQYSFSFGKPVRAPCATLRASSCAAIRQPDIAPGPLRMNNGKPIASVLPEIPAARVLPAAKACMAGGKYPQHAARPGMRRVREAGSLARSDGFRGPRRNVAKTLRRRFQ